jgi:isochorismate hydrolase
MDHWQSRWHTLISRRKIRMENEVDRSPLLLSASESVLLIIDGQDKFLTLLPRHRWLVWNLQRLAAGARIVNVPCLATEQYPEKLGPTTAVVYALLADNPWQSTIPGKKSFSCTGCAELVTSLQQVGRRQVVVGGLETHVCVLQSAMDLMTAGFDVFLCVDALGARFAVDHDTALRRMDSAGVTLTTTEGVLFEWCEAAGTDQFKQISQIVRQPPPADDPPSV